LAAVDCRADRWNGVCQRDGRGEVPATSTAAFSRANPRNAVPTPRWTPRLLLLTGALVVSACERVPTTPVAQSAPAPLAPRLSTQPDYNSCMLDVGIYWYGAGNARQKAVAGVANPYFKPARPTVLYVHGWQNGSSARRSRETFNYRQNDPTYGVDVNLADAWVNAGWNIGIFYWGQYADEGEVTDAEAKIWTPSGPRGMRWRDCNGNYNAPPAGTPSAAQLMYNAYTSAMSGYTGTTVRVAGHSLGSQMAVRFTKMVSDNVAAGRLPSNRLPDRVALLDPFFSKYGKSYLPNSAWTGEMVRRYVGELKGKGVVFEEYKTSGINALGIGDSNLGLTTMVAYADLAPWYIPSWDVAAKHVAAPNLYFYSYAFN